MSFWIYAIIGLIAGALYASQGAINARLALFSAGTLNAAFLSFVVGLVVLGMFIFTTRPAAWSFKEISSAPWWAFLGGAFGAFVVFGSALSIPKIGIATWVALFITGMLCTSVILDHIGAFGQIERSISIGRIFGVFVLFLGVFMIKRF